MDNTATIRNENERELISLLRQGGEAMIYFAFNTLLCMEAFGEPFMDEIRPLTEAGNREELIATINRYTALLPQNNT